MVGCDEPLSRDLESGKVYYASIEFSQKTDWARGCAQLVWQSAESAQAQIAILKPLDPDDVRHPAVKLK